MMAKTTVLLGASGAVLLFVAANVARTALHADTYPSYWRHRMCEPVAASALRLVALGDSSVEAIGAAQPLDGYVGRIAAYLTARTGRPVHIANVSTGGTQTPPWEGLRIRAASVAENARASVGVGAASQA